MADYKYAFKDFNPEKMARCVGKDLPLSTKHCKEISRTIRGKNLQKAKDLLAKVAIKEVPIKFTQHNRKIGHRPGIGPGRYPVRASIEIGKLLNNVEGNATFKGMDANKLVIIHIAPHQASRPMKHGRRTRGEAKRSHVEIVVEEEIIKKPETKTKIEKKEKAEKSKEDKK